MEGPLGFEPRTRGLKGHCSNQLSYGPTAAIANRLYYPDFGKKVNGLNTGTDLFVTMLRLMANRRALCPQEQNAHNGAHANNQ